MVQTRKSIGVFDDLKATLARRVKRNTCYKGNICCKGKTLGARLLNSRTQLKFQPAKVFASPLY